MCEDTPQQLTASKWVRCHVEPYKNVWNPVKNVKGYWVKNQTKLNSLGYPRILDALMMLLSPLSAVYIYIYN